MPRRVIMEDFEIDEISAVDRPAQKHARMTIMKNEDGSADNAEKEGDVTMKTAEQLQKEVDDLTKKLEVATKKAEEASEVAKSFEDLQKSVKELEAKLAKADAEKAEALEKSKQNEVLARLSEDEKAALESLDKTEAKKFLEMSSADRRKVMKKLEESDEILKVGDRQIRKSAVGVETFEIFKAQQQQIEAAQEVARVEKAAREQAEFTKRAEDELKHFSGEASVKAQILKVVSEVKDEQVRKQFEEMLKAGNGALKSAFERIGHKDGKGDLLKKADPTVFEKRVTEIANRDRISKSEAMSKARIEYADDYKAYQEAGN